LLRWSLAVVVLCLGARSASADAITFTGNVAQDFPASNPTVDIIPYTTGLVAQPQWMTQSGLVSGWNIHDLRLNYNAATDTMYVGVNTYGVAGNVDGNGTPGNPDPRLTAAFGADPANFGGDKGMAVGFAPLTGTFNPQNPPAPVIVAGVPGDKSQVGPGLDGFSVASWTPKPNQNGPTYDLVTSFGPTIASGMGNLAFDPSLQHPGFEFTIANFSKLLGANPQNGFVVSAQDGSVASVVTGKAYLFSTPVVLPAQEIIPEPATWMTWCLCAAGAVAYRLRRSRQRRALG
jgi:hypothetical protein